MRGATPKVVMATLVPSDTVHLVRRTRIQASLPSQANRRRTPMPAVFRVVRALAFDSASRSAPSPTIPANTNATPRTTFCSS